jgi:hypothetical protein
LVEILLSANAPEKLSRELESLRKKLTDKFGGMTAFVRSPGDGVWVDQGETERDTIVVLEVMTDEVDRAWWQELRSLLECRLEQKEIVIRAHAIDRL